MVPPEAYRPRLPPTDEAVVLTAAGAAEARGPTLKPATGRLTGPPFFEAYLVTGA